MSDVLIALICGVTGACCLALVLLHQGHKRQAAQISQLKAEMTAQKIAALVSLTTPPDGPASGHPEPVRRKRHLALIIGGGVAAFLAFAGEHLRTMWSRRRTAVVAASAIAAAGTVALALTSAGHPPTAPDLTIPHATAPDPSNTNVDEEPAGKELVRYTTDEQGESRTLTPQPTATSHAAAHPGEEVITSPSNPTTTATSRPPTSPTAPPSPTPTPTLPADAPDDGKPGNGNGNGNGQDKECHAAVDVPETIGVCVSLTP